MTTKTKKQLFNRGGASDLRQSVKNNLGRGEELATAIVDHFNKVNSIQPLWDDKNIEKLLLKQKKYEVSQIGVRPNYPREFARFTPSSATSCDRELLFKNLRVSRDESVMTSQQQRWVQNATGVHEARQRNLLYAEKYLDKPAFTVERIVDGENELRNGLPSWEKQLENWKVINHKGITIVVNGMMDGILTYKDGSRVGFEFKTKSNSVAQIKQLKEASPHHKSQCIAYSILFGVDEFVITYESVAKDKWGTAELARPDMKAFYIKVTERQRQKLLDKWVKVAEHTETGEIIEGDNRKCMFCPFKTECQKYTGGIRQ